MKMPEEQTRQISERATTIARALAPKDTGRGASALVPVSTTGEIGISIPASVKYMYYQDQGTPPRVMTELIGRTIPIRNRSGGIVFRRATASNVGKTIVTRDGSGSIIGVKVGWQHPGIKKQDFIGRALRQAVSEWAMSTTNRELIEMLDHSELKGLIDLLRGKS